MKKSVWEWFVYYRQKFCGKISYTSKKEILLFVLLLTFSYRSFSQVGANCYLRAFSNDGKIITPHDTVFKIDFIFFTINSELPIIKNSIPIDSSNCCYDSIKQTFSSGISYGGNEFIIIIKKIIEPKSEMKINVKMTLGFQNYQFDSIPYQEGYYEIDVAEIMREKYKDKYEEVKLEKMKWNNHADKKAMLIPIPNLWDITPINWSRVKK